MKGCITVEVCYLSLQRPLQVKQSDTERCCRLEFCDPERPAGVRLKSNAPVFPYVTGGNVCVSSGLTPDPSHYAIYLEQVMGTLCFLYQAF